MKRKHPFRRKAKTPDLVTGKTFELPPSPSRGRLIERPRCPKCGAIMTVMGKGKRKCLLCGTEQSV